MEDPWPCLDWETMYDWTSSKLLMEVWPDKKSGPITKHQSQFKAIDRVRQITREQVTIAKTAKTGLLGTMALKGERGKRCQRGVEADGRSCLTYMPDIGLIGTDAYDMGKSQ